MLVNMACLAKCAQCRSVGWGVPLVWYNTLKVMTVFSIGK